MRGSNGRNRVLVDLESMSSPTRLESARAYAARLELGADDALSNIAVLLPGRQLLMVLDNCEHLAAQAARLVQAALPQAPGVHWLVTSQEPLGLPGESRCRLETRQVPPEGTPLELARRFSAMQLWDALEALAGLVDKSWVQLERGDPPRYRLLEAMRLYASARLAGSGEAARAAHPHCATLSRMADAATVAWWQLTNGE